MNLAPSPPLSRRWPRYEISVFDCPRSNDTTQHCLQDQLQERISPGPNESLQRVGQALPTHGSPVRFQGQYLPRAKSLEQPQPRGCGSPVSTSSSREDSEKVSNEDSGFLDVVVEQPQSLERGKDWPLGPEPIQPFWRPGHQQPPSPVYQEPPPRGQWHQQPPPLDNIDSRHLLNNNPQRFCREQTTTMLNLATSPKLRGSGHLILHALRACTLVALVVIMASCWAMIVLSGLTGHFQFFDVISHFFVFAISIALFISEIGLFKPWFSNNFPILGPDHSLGWLGLALMITGCSILADLVKPAYSIDNLGLAVWRLVLASGILAITFGVFNMLASVIFRDGENGITARNIRSNGSLAVPAHQNNSKEYYDSGYQSSMRSDSVRRYPDNSHAAEDDAEPQSQPFYKRMTNHFSVPIPPKFNFRKSRNLQISKPMPINNNDDDDDVLERGNGTGYGGLNRSNNSRASPVIPDVRRPPTALHPAYTGGSHYSTAHMDRF